MYQDSASPDRPVDMETDGPLLDDFNTLKKTVEEEATEVRRSPERRAVCVRHQSVKPFWISPLAADP